VTGAAISQYTLGFFASLGQSMQSPGDTSRSSRRVRRDPHVRLAPKQSLILIRLCGGTAQNPASSPLSTDKTTEQNSLLDGHVIRLAEIGTLSILTTSGISARERIAFVTRNRDLSSSPNRIKPTNSPKAERASTFIVHKTDAGPRFGVVG
jgi:hypothetical protein